MSSSFTYLLESPSSTVQWLPSKENLIDSSYTVHKLIVGSHNSATGKHSLNFCKIKLLKEIVSDLEESTVRIEKSWPGKAYAPLPPEIDVEMSINHEGEVIKARLMPQKYNIIATKCVTGEVHILDSVISQDYGSLEEKYSTIKLLGHKGPGFGLSWNKNKLGYLLSGSDDQKICMWDINTATGMTYSMHPLFESTFHTSPVTDVQWHTVSEDVFGSVTENREIALWDIRVGKDKTAKPFQCFKGHNGPIYTIEFNSFQQNLFLTGSSDKTIALWDMRNTSKKLCTFFGHTDSVVRVEWCPTNEVIFASAGFDKKVNIWDVTTNKESEVHLNAPDCPPEPVFQLEGHMGRVADINWSTSENPLLVSVELDSRLLQLWDFSTNDNEF